MTTLQHTTAGCRDLLPAALIDYLWQMAAESDAEEQTFVLNVRHTGVGDVQEILLRRGGFSSWRRVFGYQPVQAAVQVRITDFGVIMSLVDEEADRTEVAHEEVLTCPA